MQFGEPAEAGETAVQFIEPAEAGETAVQLIEPAAQAQDKSVNPHHECKKQANLSRNKGEV